MKFINISKLRRHETTHSTNRPNVCELCGAGFKHKDGLVVHMKRHNGTLNKKFQCNQCSVKFTTQHRLAQHTLTHSGAVSYTKNIILFNYIFFNFRNLMSAFFVIELMHQKEISLSICKKPTLATQSTVAKSVQKHFHESSNFESISKVMLTIVKLFLKTLFFTFYFLNKC